MDVSELRTLTPDELKGKLKGWRDELFRSRFKVQSSEQRDTSVVRKLRREIARALTVLGEKNRGVVIAAKPVEKKAAKPKEKKAERVETPETEAAVEAKPAKKKSTKEKQKE